MKNPHSLNPTWSRSMSENPLLVSVASMNKKVKRKSREPRKMKLYPDLLDVDSVDDSSMEICNVSMLAPLQRQLMMSQDAMAGAAGGLSGLPEEVAPAQSGAIDMRIGINVPSISSKMSRLSSPPFPEISHWPTSISQPLSNRLKLGLQSTFSTSGGHSPSHQSLEPSLSSQATSLEISRACQSALAHQPVEPLLPSPKESPRKRVGLSADGPPRVPEVRAIQQTRRLLANARERTRVHTISAAFEALRKQVPCYSYGQKLSKLAILRIACNYILSLAQLAELDYGPEHSSLTFSQCVEQCTNTLQAEGRSKKRKVGRMPEDV